MARKKSARSTDENVMHRETFGRAAGNDKMIGDALTVAGVAAGTALWTATRSSTQGFFWGLGFMGLGAIGMVESQPGTVLESGSAGTLGANSAVVLLHVLGLAK